MSQSLHFLIQVLIQNLGFGAPGSPSPDFRILTRCLRAFIVLFTFLFKTLDSEPQDPKSRFQDFDQVSQSLHFLIQLLIKNLDSEPQAPKSRLQDFDLVS